MGRIDYVIDYVSVIAEDADTLLEHERNLSEVKPRQRVQLLRLLKTGQAETIAEAAQLVGLSKNHASVLWKQYKEYGISSLITTHYKDRIPRLNEQQSAMLQAECAQGFASLHTSQEWIEQHLSVPYTVTGVWRLFGGMGIKKNGRLKHYKQDLEKQEAFKQEFVADADAEDRYFSNEMRFGLHTEHKCLWTPRCIRPDWTLRLSYQYRYLSVALNPLNGHLIAAFLPDMSSESYQAFLEVVAEERLTPLRLYRDRAPSHTAGSIRVPAGIELRELPPYSPELNPAERFFEELRVVLANNVFESLEAIEAELTATLQKYWTNPKLLQRLTAFSWIRQPRGKKKQRQIIEI